MHLPNAENVVIEPRKVRDYLVSLPHPVGGHKATFFGGLGFGRDDWGSLVDALREQAQKGEATELEPSPYGRKFQVAGMIGGEEVVTIWIILDAEEAPRLITAYPGGKP